MFWKNFSFAGENILYLTMVRLLLFHGCCFFFSLRAWKQLSFFLIFILFPHTLEILRFKFDLGGFAEQFLWGFCLFSQSCLKVGTSFVLRLNF